MPFNTQLAHLVDLASRHAAGKRYAWGRALELDTEPSGLFTGMSKALTSAMAGQALSFESEPPTEVKPNSVGPKSITP